MSLIAIAIGIFYVVAGIIVLRVMTFERMLDKALTSISGKASTDIADQVRVRVLTGGALLTLASGAATILLSPIALLIYIANVIVQGGYIAWADRAIPPESPDDATGRQTTKNAFVVYMAATAFIAWMQYQGGMRPWYTTWEVWAMDALAIVVLTVLGWQAIWIPQSWFSRTRDDGKAPIGFSDNAPPRAREALDKPEHLRLAPEWQCWPLWDDATGDNLYVYDLDLPLDLVERIDLWDSAWQQTYNGDDPRESGYKDEAAQRAYVEEGRAIAAALRAAWPGHVVVVEPLDPQAD